MKTLPTILLILLLTSTWHYAQSVDRSFFDQTDTFLKAHVENGLVNYANAKSDAGLLELIQRVENADINGLDTETRKAFLINAYNLHVIHAATQSFPLNSVLSESGFFDRKKITVAGQKITLNELEKGMLLKPYKDARLHFVLVCGALGCPPITNFAYRPDQLEQQLERQTRLAINNPQFIRIQDGNAELSQIFQWYAADFGGSTANILEFINKYRATPIPDAAKVKYYDYDWSLNDTTAGSATNSGSSTDGPANAGRYIVSSTIRKGGIELKIFNNLYSQQTGSSEILSDRSTFFTTTVSFLYGLNDRFNVGFNTRYRRVRNESLPSSPFGVFSPIEEGSARQGLTAFGPQIRYAPVERWQNFSVQSSFVFAIGEDLAGSATQPYIDWNGATWWTQFFNDFTIGNNFSLFTEIDFLWEDIGSAANGHVNRISTPATLIFSYSPNTKTVLYTLGGFSPYWQSEFDYFTQVGLGAKYQFTSNFELELLLTDFSNKFLNETGGRAATYNLGIRYNL